MFGIVAQLILCSYFVLQNVSPSFQTPSRIILDITKPMNALKEGKTSKEDFLATISSSKKCPDSSELAFFYQLDADLSHFDNSSGSIKNAVREIWNVSYILNETLATTSTVQLITNFPSGKGLLNELNSTAWKETYYFSKIQLTIVINPMIRNDSDHKTEDWIRLFKMPVVRHIFGISKSQNLRLGLATYDTNGFIGRVFRNGMDLHTSDVTFLTYTKYLETSLELEDSFKFFQTQVKTNTTFSALEIAYHPMVSSDSFTEMYGYNIHGIYSNVQGTSVILEIPDENNQMYMNQKFSVIPYLTSMPERAPTTGISLTTPLLMALEASNKGFNTVLLSNSQWVQLKSEGVFNLLRRFKPAATQLGIILDYSEEPISSINQSLLNTFDDNQIVPKVEALVFKLADNESESYSIDLSNVKNLPTKPKIGCSLRNLSFFDSDATKIVNACKDIGGSLYILKSTIYLRWNTIDKKSLIPVRNLRNEILLLHPDATVYLQLDVVKITNNMYGYFSRYYPTVYNEDALSFSTYCGSDLQRINGAIMTIITWANGYNFPLILKSVMKKKANSTAESGQWFSFLRKVPHINQRIDQNHKSCKEATEYGFPIAYNENYRTDPCIERTYEKPEISVNYFNNNNIGAVFHTDDVQINGTTRGNVLTTMLQFVLHAFRLTEIVSSSYFPDVLAAISSVSKLNSAVETSTVFVNYIASENETEVEVGKFAEFLNQLEKSPLMMVAGIHIDVPKYTNTGVLLSTREYELKKLTLSKYLHLQSLFKRKIKGVSFAPRFGVVLSTEKFLELIQYFSDESEFYKDYVTLLSQTDYVVFYQKFDGLQVDALIGKYDQEPWFNKHLHYKRIIQNLFPHLEVYFRIELDIEFTSSSKKLKEYLMLLSHAKAFSSANNFSYFIVEAFDNGMNRKNGWWAIKSDGDPANPKSYVEKETEFSGRYQWYPSPSIPQPELIEALQFSPWYIASLSAAFGLLLIAVVVGSVFIVRYRKLRQFLSDDEIQDFLKGRLVSEYTNDATNGACAAESMKFDSKFELQMSEIFVDSKNILGMGNFGTVFKGNVKGDQVAIKQPKRDCPKGTFKSLLTEIKVHCYIGAHSNVVRFIGAYTKEIQQGVILIATELCFHGSLEKLLRTKRLVVSEQEAGLYQSSQLENMLHFSDLHRFARDIASGMEYIESKNIVHGDLSARNILLDENLICKIGDFGLARKLYEYQKYVKTSQEPLPWKWLAVESLAKMEFTSKSDVWSFGVTIWEIYSLGDSPYAGLNWTVEFVDELRKGLRLPIPQFATPNIHKIMLRCWNLDVDQRPTFTTLCNFFRQLCDTQYTILGEL